MDGADKSRERDGKRMEFEIACVKGQFERAWQVAVEVGRAHGIMEAAEEAFQLTGRDEASEAILELLTAQIRRTP